MTPFLIIISLGTIESPTSKIKLVVKPTYNGSILFIPNNYHIIAANGAAMIDTNPAISLTFPLK